MESCKKQTIATTLIIASLLCTGCKPVENSLSTLSNEDDNANATTFKIFQPLEIKSVEQTAEVASKDITEVMEYVQDVKVGIVNDVYHSTNQTLISTLTNKLTEQVPNLLVEMVTPEMNNANSYLNSVNELIAKGVQIVLIPNQTYEKELEPIIKNYSDIIFVTLDSFTHSSNVLGLKFRDEASAYLAGIIAASQSTTNQVAYLAYEENKEFNSICLEGFRAGVKAINEYIVITEKYISKDATSVSIQEITRELYQQNHDIIFENLNLHQQEVIAVAKDYTSTNRPVFVINSTLDLSENAPELNNEPVILSTTVKNIDVAICNVLTNLLDGNLVLGTQMILGLENNGVDVTLTSQSLNQITTDLVEDYKEKIINGEVIVPTQVNPLN